MSKHLTEILCKITLLTHSVNRKFFDSNELDAFYTDLKMEGKLLVEEQREENDPFLKLMVIVDVKWIVYNNVAHKRSWKQCDEPPKSTPKGNIHQK